MTTAQVFAGVDISKDRLDVCLRWSEPERHNEVEAVVVAYDSGIDALVSRLLEERPELVILEATGGFERTVVEALAAVGLAVVVVNPRQVRDFARATGSLRSTATRAPYAAVVACGEGGPRSEWHCIWAPWSPPAAAQSYRNSTSVWLRPANRRRWLWWPACASCSRSSTPFSNTVLPEGLLTIILLDIQDSCFFLAALSGSLWRKAI
jgi:hypothetical protein